MSSLLTKENHSHKAAVMLTLVRVKRCLYLLNQIMDEFYIVNLDTDLSRNDCVVYQTF